MSSKLEVRMRRVYDHPSSADGTRVLVDRILATRPGQGDGKDR